MSGASTPENLETALQILPTAVRSGSSLCWFSLFLTLAVEWMVHPGFADPSYGDEFNRSSDREVEYRMLLSANFRSCISQLGFRLGGWEDINGTPLLSIARTG
jgi:hypothetical protein